MEPPAPFHPTATRRERKLHVRVGVGIMLVLADNDDDNCHHQQQQQQGDDAQSSWKVYAGYRRGSHGENTLALPGGHLEMGESWVECASREVMEEMGIEIDRSSVRFIHATNDVFEDESKHYVTLFLMAKAPRNVVPINLEPHKCNGWEKYSIADLWDRRDDLFLPLRHLLDEMSHRQLEEWMARCIIAKENDTHCRHHTY